MLSSKMAVQQGLRLLPSAVPSAPAKIFTYFRLFAKPDKTCLQVESLSEVRISQSRGCCCMSGWAYILTVWTL